MGGAPGSPVTATPARGGKKGCWAFGMRHWYVFLLCRLPGILSHSPHSPFKRLAVLKHVAKRGPTEKMGYGYGKRCPGGQHGAADPAQSSPRQGFPVEIGDFFIVPSMQFGRFQALPAAQSQGRLSRRRRFKPLAEQQTFAGEVLSVLPATPEKRYGLSRWLKGCEVEYFRRGIATTRRSPPTRNSRIDSPARSA